VVERPDLLADERLSTNEGRVAHRGEVEGALTKAFAAHSAEVWLERLEASGIPCGRVNDVGEVLRHPQLEHNRLVTEVDSPVGRIQTIGNPFLVDGERPPVGPVPGLGKSLRPARRLPALAARRAPVLPNGRSSMGQSKHACRRSPGRT